MNPSLIFQIFAHNAADLLAIENKIGGLPNILKLAPHLETIYHTFEVGGIEAVLAANGPNIQVIISTIGIENLAAVMPHAAAILKTVNGVPK